MKKPARYFRAGVGAVLTDGRGRVLVLERIDVRGAWQFAQGGLKKKEEPLDGALREAEEETGIPSGALALIRRYPGLLAYELPRKAQSVKTGMGQVQYWFRFRVKDEHPANIRVPADSEFRAAEWVPFSKAVARSVGFRKNLYRSLQQEFETEITKRAPSTRARSARQRTPQSR